MYTGINVCCLNDQVMDSVMELWYVAKVMAIQFFGVPAGHPGLDAAFGREQWKGWKTTSEAPLRHRGLPVPPPVTVELND